MRPRALLFLAVAAGLLTATPAEAKFSISLTVEPKHVWAKQPARVTVRTGIVLPRKHGLRLQVVGPGKPGSGVTSFEVRLRRIGPRAFKATVRFPRGGRWRLIVPNWGAPGSAHPPPVDRTMKVQPIP